MDVRKKTKAALVAELDQCELACKLMEIAIGLKRPPGVTAADAAKDCPPEMWAQFMKMAEVSLRYMEECVNNGKIPS